MRGLMSAAAICAILSAPSWASAALPKVLTQEKPPFQLKPATISYTGDGTGIIGGLDGTSVRNLGHLKWGSYDKREGLATGLVWLDDCKPDCARGTFTSSRVKVRVSSPSQGHFRLLTLRYRYRGRRYVDRRLAHYYAGGGLPGYWQYEICGRRFTPKC